MKDFTAVYAELHKILAPYSTKLDTKKDDESELYVDTKHIQKKRSHCSSGPFKSRSHTSAFTSCRST